MAAEASTSPVEGLEPSKVTSLAVHPSQGATAPRVAITGIVEFEHGYYYVEGVPQALRLGWDLDSHAKVGDKVECTYGPRSYGAGWYGKVVSAS